MALSIFRMEFSVGADEARDIVWLEVPVGMTDPSIKLQPYYRDNYDGVVLIEIPVSDVDNGPQCQHCGKVTLKLRSCFCDGDHLDLCSSCDPETQRRPRVAMEMGGVW